MSKKHSFDRPRSTRQPTARHVGALPFWCTFEALSTNSQRVLDFSKSTRMKNLLTVQNSLWTEVFGF